MGPRILVTVLVVAGTACATKPCEDAPAAVNATVTIGDADLRARLHSLDAALVIDGTRYEKTFLLEGTLNETTTFAVVLDPAPAADGFDVELHVAARTEAQGAAAAEGTDQIKGTLNACNQIKVTLGAPPNRDGGVGDAGELPPTLVVSPTAFDAPWTDRGQTLSFLSNVAYDGNASSLSVTATVAWLDATITSSVGSDSELTFEIDTTPLEAGTYAVTAAVSAPGVPNVDVSIRFRVFRPLYVGPETDSCPHRTPAGVETAACNYVGRGAIITAVDAALPFDHFILYDQNGSPALYDSQTDGLQLPGVTWIGAAKDIDPENVVVRCLFHRGLRLMGDGVRVEGFSLISAGGADQLISSWRESTPEDGTGRHEIDRMVIAALRAEVFGANSIQYALALSEDTRLTNSWIYGHWEGIGDLSFADRSTLIGNTFVAYQAYENTIIAAGTQDLTIANNVFIALPSASEALVVGDVRTSGLRLVGNVFEGFTGPIVLGLAEFDDTNIVDDNTVGAPGLESPGRPRFFMDAQPVVSEVVLSVGHSFDGVDVDGTTPELPGAFQIRSDNNGPRRTVVRVGPETCAGCDFTTLDDNEVQLAAWSLWPGGTLEIERGTFAGNVVVSWPIVIRGIGAPSDAIVLASADEDRLLAQLGTWWSHDAVVAFTWDAAGPAALENLTIVAQTGKSTSGTGVFLEGHPPGASASLMRTNNVEVRTGNDTGQGLDRALVAGDGVVLQEILVRGSWALCARVVGANASSSPFPPVSAIFVNLTCRLQGTGDHEPLGGFEVASVIDTQFINVIVEATVTSTSTGVFRAQRRTGGDDALLARDPPQSLDAFAVHHRGFGALFSGFEATSGTYDVAGATELQPAAPLFRNATDSHLAANAPALDSGVDPASIDNRLSRGTALDGVSRSGRVLDRGCYEQNN